MKLVKIKTWDKMEREFPEKTGIGSILIKSKEGFDNTFTSEMEEEMPKDRVVEIKLKIKRLDDKNIEFFKWSNWTITDEMIEMYLNPKDHPEYFI